VPAVKREGGSHRTVRARRAGPVHRRGVPAAASGVYQRAQGTRPGPLVGRRDRRPGLRGRVGRAAGRAVHDPRAAVEPGWALGHAPEAGLPEIWRQRRRRGFWVATGLSCVLVVGWGWGLVAGALRRFFEVIHSAV